LVNGVSSKQYSLKEQYIEFFHDGTSITSFSSLGSKKLDCEKKLELIYNRELKYKANGENNKEIFMQKLFNILIDGVNK
jgi:hypothetical protein